MSNKTAPATPLGSVEDLIPRPARIRARKAECDGVITLDIETVSKNNIRFESGQFNMLYVFGIGEIPISHSGDAKNKDYYTHTIRSVGAVSSALSRLAVGDVIGIRGPYGTGWQEEKAKGRDIVIIAGGLGLAPLRPLIYQIADNRSAFGSISLLYGARDPDNFLFSDELRIAADLWQLDLYTTVDSADIGWTGNVGFVTQLIEKAKFTAENTTAYLCGPDVMMRVCARSLTGYGVPEEHIFLSLERNMKCAIKHCGRCQFSSRFVCRDGPVFSYADIKQHLSANEI